MLSVLSDVEVSQTALDLLLWLCVLLLSLTIARFEDIWPRNSFREVLYPRFKSRRLQIRKLIFMEVFAILMLANSNWDSSFVASIAYARVFLLLWALIKIKSARMQLPDEEPVSQFLRSTYFAK